MASLKALRATHAGYMPNDGRAHWITDKAILGAGQLGTPAVGDTVDFRIPAGTRLCELAFVVDDCDTGATAQASIGYRPADSGSSLAADATYFAAAGVFAQAAGRVECTFKPIKFEEDVYVSIKYTAAPAGLSGNPEIHMVASGNAEGVK